MRNAHGTILLVDSDEQSIRRMQEAFQEIKTPHQLEALSSGADALAFLTGKGRFEDRSEDHFPCVLLLDPLIHSPDGFEILKWIRQQPKVKRM